MVVESAATDAATPHLGREVAARLSRPGPRLGRLRPASIGSIASASQRFAHALARPVPARRMLQGPVPVSAHSVRAATVRPPRWWDTAAAAAAEARAASLAPVVAPAAAAAPAVAPVARFGRPAAVQAEQLPERGLPRAVRSVPNERERAPGGITDSLVSVAAPVRRLDDVVAAGPMLMQHDRAKLNARVAGPAPAGPRATGPPSGAASDPSTRSAAPDVSRQMAPHPSSGQHAPSGIPPSGQDVSRPNPSSSQGFSPSPDSSAAPFVAGALALAGPAPSWQPSRISRLTAVRRSRSTRQAQSTRRAESPYLATRSAQTGVLAPAVRRQRLQQDVQVGAPTTDARQSAGAVASQPDRAASPVESPADIGGIGSELPPVEPTLAPLPRGSAPRAGGVAFGVARAGDAAISANPEPMARGSVTPLRRMVGPGHALRPATRTSEAATAPAAAGVRAAGARETQQRAAKLFAVPSTPATRPTTAQAAPTSPAPNSPTRSMPPAPAVRGIRAAVQQGRALRPALGAAALPTAPLARIPQPARTSPAASPEASMITSAPRPTAKINPTISTAGNLTAPGGAPELFVMRDLLATGQSAARGAAPGKSRSLASGFGPSDVIRPAIARQVAAAGVVPARVPADGPLPTPERRRTSSAASSAPTAPTAAGRTTTGRTTATGEPGGYAITDLPAPPRFGIRRAPTPAPTPKTATPKTPTPKTATSKSVPPAMPKLVQAPDGSLRPSLVDTTADLFRSPDPSMPGGPMTAPSQRIFRYPGTGTPVPAAGTANVPAEAPQGANPILDDPRSLTELVDKVVDRIEARVVDELERRGRRHSRGAF